MRTTVDIPDPLYRRLKAKAAREGHSMKDLILRYIERNLHESLERRGRVTAPIIDSDRPGSLDLDNEKIFEIIPF